MKKAIITGVSSGIGKALYDYLKEQGWIVLGIGRRDADVICDLGDESQVNLLCHTLRHLDFKIDLFVHNAGIMPLDERGREKEIMQVNFLSVVKLNEVVREKMNSGGLVLYMGSISSIKPDASLPVYAASKASLSVFCKTQAKLDAPKNVRHVCLQLGYYKTNLVPGETPKELIQEIPLGYEDIPENLVPFILQCYEMKYLTGCDIRIDGGLALC